MMSSHRAQNAWILFPQWYQGNNRYVSCFENQAEHLMTVLTNWALRVKLPNMLTGIKQHFMNGNYLRVRGNKGHAQMWTSNFRMVHVQNPEQSWIITLTLTPYCELEYEQLRGFHQDITQIRLISYSWEGGRECLLRWGPQSNHFVQSAGRSVYDKLCKHKM